VRRIVQHAGAATETALPRLRLALQASGPSLSSRFVAVKKKQQGRVRPQQTALLEELKTAAEKLGLRVREEKLLREVGYRVRSGRCRVREDEIIFLERGLPVDSQIDVLVDELASRAVDAIYLSPAARTLIERAAQKGAFGDGEGRRARG